MLDASWTLLATAASKAIATGAFAFVAGRLASRRVSAAARSANHGFAFFWAALAAWSAFGGALDAMAALGAHPAAAWIVGRYASLFLFCAGFAGFIHYVAYVYVGERARLAPVVVAYALLFALLAALVAASEPNGVAVGPWRSDVSYASPPEGPIVTLAALFLLAPPLVAALAYARLHARLQDPEQRRRSRIMSAALIAWFVALFLSTLARDPIGFFVTRPLAGTAVAALVVIAHAPRRANGPREPRADVGLARRAQDLV